MSDLTTALEKLNAKFREGSYTAWSRRGSTLSQISRQLGEAGFDARMNAEALDENHVRALLERWQREKLAPSTMRHRLSVLRWWANHIGKEELIPTTNAALGVVAGSPKKEQSVDSSSPASTDDEADNYAHASIALQQHFALSREESLRFVPSVADLGDRIRLKGGWCKSGRSREIPIIRQEQRKALDQALAIAGKGSLIPVKSDIDSQSRVFDRCLIESGQRGKGYRQAYAQKRYREIMHKECPLNGGFQRDTMSDIDQLRDKRARKTIAAELGNRNPGALVALIGR